MELNTNLLVGHCQRAKHSCIPMSVECVLKLLQLMPQGAFPLQNDGSKIGTSKWIKDRFSYPIDNPKVKFDREFLLSDIGLPDRGPHFIKDGHFDKLFRRIDYELSKDRYVIISLESNPPPDQMWHLHVIYERINENEYKTLTYIHGDPNPRFERKDLRQVVTYMQGTDILTYNWI